jgi:hypothetical protein
MNDPDEASDAPFDSLRESCCAQVPLGAEANLNNLRAANPVNGDLLHNATVEELHGGLQILEGTPPPGARWPDSLSRHEPVV